MVARADMAGMEILRTPERAAALLDPERRRLLVELSAAPDSASGLARRLGETRQRLNYHMRALEDVGLLELQEERRRGNCLERVMRVVARRFVIDPAALGPLAAEPDDTPDRFSATYLIATAARTIRELAALTDKAARQRKRLATAVIDTEVRLATPSDFPAFVQDLSEAIARVVAKHHDEAAGGRPLRVTTGIHPAPPRRTESTEGGRE